MDHLQITTDMVYNLKCILIARAKYGATLNEIIEDYRDLVGENIKLSLVKFVLKNLGGVWHDQDSWGNYIWHVESNKSKHIIDMVKQQKDERNPPKKKKTSCPTTTNSHSKFYSQFNNPINAYFENNQNYNYRMSNLSKGYLHSFQLFGDDFFLWMAVNELKSKLLQGHKVQQSGFCISGQTIKDAIRRVYMTQNIDNNVIVNLGSVDILHGHEYIEILSDYSELLRAFKSRGISPILTTIAPLANLAYSPEVKLKVLKFNQFIRNLDENVIDIYECMANQNHKIIYECYQIEARYVTGSCQPHLLWNKIGRQRVLKYLKKNIAYLFEY